MSRFCRRIYDDDVFECLQRSPSVGRQTHTSTVADGVSRVFMRGRKSARSQGRRRESIAKIALRAESPALGSHAMLMSLIKHVVYPSEPNNPLTHGG